MSAHKWEYTHSGNYNLVQWNQTEGKQGTRRFKSTIPMECGRSSSTIDPTSEDMNVQAGDPHIAPMLKEMFSSYGYQSDHCRYLETNDLGVGASTNFTYSGSDPFHLVVLTIPVSIFWIKLESFLSHYHCTMFL